MFGRSTASDSSAKRDSVVSKDSKDAISPPNSSPHPGARETFDSGSVVSRHSRGKKSIDGGKPTDRLSLFGGAFNGSIGKSRKPAPRYSS